jgi:hypothetical protein
MAGNGQPGRILQAMPVPNPNPTGLAVQLDGPADGVAVKIYSKALTRVLNLKVDRRLSAGWSTVALPVGWSSGMARGLYYVVVRPITGGAEGKGPGPVKLVCLR